MRVVAYLRISTQKQADGLGPAEQRAAIDEWARSNGHTITRYVQDAISGASEIANRTGWAEVEDDLRDKTADAVVVSRLDRLARDLVVQETLIQRVGKLNCRVYSTREGENDNLVDDPDDPTRKLMRSFLGALAAYDREITVLRLRNARKAKAQRGGYAHGAPPYGWTGSGGKLHKVPAEQAVLARILALRAAGGSTRAIAATLNIEGHPTKRSGTWNSSSVSHIIARNEHRPVKEATA